MTGHCPADRCSVVFAAASVRTSTIRYRRKLLAVELAAVKVLAFTIERRKTGRGEW
jgi:hypothetical protein